MNKTRNADAKPRRMMIARTNDRCGIAVDITHSRFSLTSIAFCDKWLGDEELVGKRYYSISSDGSLRFRTTRMISISPIHLQVLLLNRADLLLQTRNDYDTGCGLQAASRLPIGFHFMHARTHLQYQFHAHWFTLSGKKIESSVMVRQNAMTNNWTADKCFREWDVDYRQFLRWNGPLSPQN